MRRKKKYKSRSEQKTETRALILQTAEKLILEKGYDRTTMRNIAAQAGIATGTILAHFPNKPSLLAATLMDYLEAVLVEVVSATSSERELIEVITQPIKELYRLFGEIRNLVQVWFTETMFMGGPWGEKIDELFEFCRLFNKEILLDAQKKGQLTADCDCDLLATSIMSHYMYALIFGLKGKLDVEEQSRLLVQLVESHLRGYMANEQ